MEGSCPQANPFRRLNGLIKYGREVTSYEPHATVKLSTTVPCVSACVTQMQVILCLTSLYLFFFVSLKCQHSAVLGPAVAPPVFIPLASVKLRGASSLRHVWQGSSQSLLHLTYVQILFPFFVYRPHTPLMESVRAEPRSLMVRPRVPVQRKQSTKTDCQNQY